MVGEPSNYEYIFVGGAPRSGTTLVASILDSHPDFLVFPFEHKVFEYWFIHTHERKFYLNEFIENRACGQQSIMASRSLIREYEHKMEDEYNKIFKIDIDSERFINVYKKVIRESNAFCIGTIFHALILGLCESNKYAQKKYSTAKYIVFKQPFYTDLFIENIIGEIPNAKVLSILRNPIDRYVSAKTRRMHVLKNKKLRNINKNNYVLGHSEIDIAIRYLNVINSKRLDENNYHCIRFEHLINQNSSELALLNAFLRIDNVIMFLDRPTRLGKVVLPGSSLTGGSGLDRGSVERGKKYYEITNHAERVVHKSILHRCGLSKERVHLFYTLLYMLIPFKYSSFKHYPYQIRDIYRVIHIDAKSVALPMITKLKQGQYYDISGAT